MKIKEVYRKDYYLSKTEGYYSLIKKIKSLSFEDICPEREYLSFDGDFLLKVSFSLNKNNYSKRNIAKIIVEKIGPDVSKESKIEKMLLEKGFKKEEK